MKQESADVAVVASGPAGLAAAITLAEGGANVIVLEKAPVTGGIAGPEIRGGTGFFAVESRLQRQKLITLTREEAFKIHMDYTHWRVDARLVKAFIDKSVSTMEWVESMGVEFLDVRGHNPGLNPTWHVVKGPAEDPRDPAGTGSGPYYNPAGARMAEVMTNRAKQLGVKFLLQTPAKRLIKENGYIVGVMAENESRESIQVKAKAVIIATGGFGDNPQMIKEYTGYEWGSDIATMRIPGRAGDGIRMALEVGAAVEGMTMDLTTCSLPLGRHPFRHTVVYRAFSQPNLIVNLLGERFMDEEIMVQNPSFAANAVFRQKNGSAFNIFDEATAKHYEKYGLHWDPIPIAGGFDAGLKEAFGEGNENIFVVDSLEELAAQTGIYLDTLKETVAEYNLACEKRRDELFGKNYRFLRPVKQPRFYAGRIMAGGFGSLGGIKINYRTEVLTKEFEVIPGLYAAGTDANAIYADSYVFPLPGNTIGFALNSGRIAGENALKYLESFGGK